jgi:Mg2+ and Co2+ transporter CorA
MRKDINRAWFPGISGNTESGGYARAIQIDDRIDGALGRLRRFAESLRASYDLMQIRESEIERERDDRFQRTIAVGGGAILIPTLVAGVMGANTWVPGEYGPNSPRWAFIALLAFVAVSALGGWLLLRKMRHLDDRDR